MADEDTFQPPSPPVEAPTPPQAATAPTEPETTQSESVGAQPTETRTAQVPVNEPIAPVQEPPSAAATMPTATHAARDLLVKARATIQGRKRKKLDKILELLNAKGKIINDEVEKLLHVSDATATRYLSALEKEGKIKQVGKTGTGVEYTKV